VNMLLRDWLPDRVEGVHDTTLVPALLRSLVRFAHAERGLRPELTTGTLAMVDRLAPAYHLIAEAERSE
jgi:hypothetical protein